MNRTQESDVDETNSEPNTVRLTDGSYIQWDHKDGFFRVAYYQRTARKGGDLEYTIALAMKKPVHNSKVKKIFGFISQSDSYAACS